LLLTDTNLFIDICACACQFHIGGNSIENVNKFSHLGHIITSSFNDVDDIGNRRNSLFCQSNKVYVVLIIWVCQLG